MVSLGRAFNGPRFQMRERCSDEIWQVFYLLEEKSGKLMPKLVVGSRTQQR